MKIFFWKNNEAIHRFANNIANDLFSVVQQQSMRDFFQSSVNDKSAKKNRKNVEAKISIVMKQIQQFRATH